MIITITVVIVLKVYPEKNWRFSEDRTKIVITAAGYLLKDIYMCVCVYWRNDS